MERSRASSARARLTMLVVGSTVLCAAVPPRRPRARWSRSVRTQSGAGAVLGFAPWRSGGDRLVAPDLLPDQGRWNRVRQRGGADGRDQPAGHGRFGRPVAVRARVPGDRVDKGHPPLQQILLPRGGDTVLIFAGGDVAPASALVKPAGSARFERGQAIVPLVHKDNPQGNSYVDAASTSRGEVVAVGQDDSGADSFATLRRGAARFRLTRPALKPLSADFPLLAVDGIGGAYVGGEVNRGCDVIVYYRRPGGTFQNTYKGHAGGTCDADHLPVPVGVVAQGRRALLVTETLDESNTGPSPMYVQTGSAGRFGAATFIQNVYSGEPEPLYGVRAAPDGTATMAWQHCDSESNADELAYSDCGVDAAVGTVAGGFTEPPTVLAAGGKGVHSDALLAPGAVAVHRCETGGCTLSLVTVRADHQFSRPIPVASNARRLIAAIGDRHGDLALVWTDPEGNLYAATRDGGSARVSRPHRLAGPGIKPANVQATFGPRREAIVAWSRRTGTSAAVYDVGARRPAAVGTH